MSSVLGRLAGEVGVSERTLRRGVGSGLIRARRPSARQLFLSEEEAAWVRLHWSLVARLRGALRTEPNVLRDGRPLVDRERSWPRLRAQAGRTQAETDQLGKESRARAVAALGYFQELAGVGAWIQSLPST